MTRNVLVGLVALVLGSAVAPPAADARQAHLERRIPTADEVVVARSAQGVAATLNVEASRAAVEVLEAGGNAMDAAAAAWMVLSVVSPNQTGLGGGGYIIYYEATTGQTWFIDANIRAPMAAHPGVFLGDNGEPLSTAEIRRRGMAVGVPGLVRGLDVALKRWGTRYFDTLARRAIELAEDGWAVDRELSLRIHQTRESLGEHARAVYMPRGEPLEPGELLVQRDKARSLRLIAEHGSAAFYQGEIADAVAGFVQGLGGFLTAEDFHRYNASVEQPFWFSYRDYWIATNPNNAGGHTLAMKLKLLEPFDLGGFPIRSAERYHLLLEAARIASSGSNLFADPEYVDRPWQGMLSDAFLAGRRALIQPGRRLEEIPDAEPWAYQAGSPYRARGQHPGYAETAATVDAPVDAGEWDEETDHFTIVDAAGNVVAVTTTLGTAWLAGHMVPGYGFMLNVTGAYFDTRPGGPHEIRPGKRPRSSMTPTIAFRDGRPILTVGTPSPAGMQHVQVLINILDHGMDVAAAVAEPRVAPASTWEAGVPPRALEALRALGHPMSQNGGNQGGVSVVFRDGDVWLGAADPRRDGVAIGVGSGSVRD